MDRDELIHELSKTITERDHWRGMQEEARIKADTAQSRAYELELILFEPQQSIVPFSVPRNTGETITHKVLAAFFNPAGVREVASKLGLTRSQVQVVVTTQTRRKRLVRKSRGVYALTRETREMLKEGEL